jgi:hypothetical protein
MSPVEFISVSMPRLSHSSVSSSLTAMPLVLVVLIILFLRRKRVVNVTVAEIKPSRRAGGGVQKWIYTCSVGDMVIGKTAATPL